jgi:hypothetical protein
MPTSPAVKASTLPESRGKSLKEAIAEILLSTKEGRTELARISEKVSKQEREQHTRDMRGSRRK